jgi:cytochrome c5
VRLFDRANLPYTMAIVISLGILIPFVMFTDPFSSGAASGATLAPSDVSFDDVATDDIPADTTGDTAGTGNAVVAVSTGEEIYNGTCVVCHGAGGVGIAGLGKSLIESDFADGLTDDEFLAFLDVGRPSDDPLNTTGIAMPPRGGNAGLTDDDLLAVIAYVRSLKT